MLNRALMAAVLVLVAATPSDMLACGDKFLVPSRGIRFQGPPLDRESATILLYASTDSALGAALKTLSVEDALRKAGYRPTTVASAADFDTRLRAARWDVLVIDLADGPEIARRLPSTAAPIVLPVAYGTAGVSADGAKTQYQQVLKSPKKNKAFLDAVDKVIAERAKARTKSSTKSTD